jgi:Ser/Thr protein kinase RdoA (MazF antagonist)
MCVFNSTTRARHADNNPKPKAFLELSGHVRARHPHNLRELAAAEDIKPRNWVYEADVRTIKLIDFGFSVKGVLAR